MIFDVKFTTIILEFSSLWLHVTPIENVGLSLVCKFYIKDILNDNLKIDFKMNRPWLIECVKVIEPWDFYILLMIWGKYEIKGS